jgi:hypothetical protein
MIGFFDAAFRGGIGMFDHQLLSVPAQIALLFMAAAAKAPQRRAVRAPARGAGITALILVVVTVVIAGFIAHLELTGLRAEGRVVAIRPDADGFDREPTYFPVIEFATAAGALARFEDFGASSPRYRVGDRVAVLYRGDETSRFAIVDRDRRSNLLLPLLPFGGAVLLGWPFLRHFRSRVRARTAGRPASRTVRGTARPQRRMMNA